MFSNRQLAVTLRACIQKLYETNNIILITKTSLHAIPQLNEAICQKTTQRNKGIANYPDYVRNRNHTE